jgi:hypothetical protein
MDIAPIETVYKGYRFRSRLEARWAVFFETCGKDWSYEPEGFDLGDLGYYLPDFLVQYKNTPTWIEIKPKIYNFALSMLALAKMAKLSEITKTAGLVYFGDPLEFEGFIFPIFKEGEVYEHIYPINFSPDDLCENSKRAAKIARSARFEFGESG